MVRHGVGGWEGGWLGTGWIRSHLSLELLELLLLLLPVLLNLLLGLGSGVLDALGAVWWVRISIAFITSLLGFQVVAYILWLWLHVSL